MKSKNLLSRTARNIGLGLAGLAGLIMVDGCVGGQYVPQAEPLYGGIRSRYFVDETTQTTDSTHSNMSLLGALLLGAGSFGAKTPQAATTMVIGSDLLKTKAQIDGNKESVNQGRTPYHGRNYEVINGVLVNRVYSIAVSDRHRAVLFTYTGYFDHNGNKFMEPIEFFHLGETGFSPDVTHFAFSSETDSGSIKFHVFTSEGKPVAEFSNDYKPCQVIQGYLKTPGGYILTATLNDGTCLSIGMIVKDETGK